MTAEKIQDLSVRYPEFSTPRVVLAARQSDPLVPEEELVGTRKHSFRWPLIESFRSKSAIQSDCIEEGGG